MVGDQGSGAVSESVPPFAEQRQYPRFEVAIPIALDVESGGVATTGTVVNLGRGGLLARVQDLIDVGARCAVRFPISGGRYSGVRPAVVVRSHSHESSYLVALQFDSPLPEPSGSESPSLPSEFLSRAERNFLVTVRDHSDEGAPVQAHAADNTDAMAAALRTLRALGYVDLRHNGYWITAAGRAALK